MTEVHPREVLICTIARLLDGVRHVAVGASSPIPAAGAMLLRALQQAAGAAGPRIEQLAIESIDAQSEPAQMTVRLQVRGRRYVEDRDTAALISGSRDRETAFTERWTMALAGDGALPWRLVGVG